jgi:hypothetical protein
MSAASGKKAGKKKVQVKDLTPRNASDVKGGMNKGEIISAVSGKVGLPKPK